MKKMIIAIAAFVMFMSVTADTVRGEETVDTAPKLGVDIILYNGESVLVKPDHVFYSAVPVTFSPAQTGGENFYSISIDGGSNFGGFAEVENGKVTLYPDDDTSPDRSWQIRFRSVDDEEGEIFSDTYSVSFDVNAPSIVFENEDEADGWISPGTEIMFSFADEGSGIGRIMAVCNGETIAEEHFADGNTPHDHCMSFLPGETAGGSDTVEVTCVDLAGNTARFSFEYMCDTVSPRIDVQGIENGAGISESGILNIRSSDNSKEVYTDYVIKRTVGDDVFTTEVSNAPKETSLTFDEDGRYVVSMRAVDGAGNRSDEVRRVFTVDKNAPMIEISGLSGADMRSAAAVTIDVREELWEKAKVNINLTRSSVGSCERIPITSYDLMGKRDTRTVNISTDGDYVLEVAAQDGAGNTTRESKSFRIDQNAPGIAIFGADEGGMTSDIPTLKFSAAELFYDSTIMTAVLEKREGIGYTPVKTGQKVMKSAEDSLEITPDDEGEYRLTCTAADRSGNSAQTSLSFTVDRTPPVISALSDIDNRFFKSFSLPKKIAEMVSDRFGVKGYAYVNDEEINDNDRIIEEGKYTLSVIAEDEAGNVAEKSATFIVDHTAPQIVIRGFGRNGNIKKGSMLSVGLTDSQDKLLSVRFGDRNIAVGTDNTANIVVDDYGEYDLEVKAEDPAGNVTDTVIHASCYMYSPFMSGQLKTGEKTISDAAGSAKKDSDPLMLAIGMISVLSGTYGLTWRASHG